MAIPQEIKDILAQSAKGLAQARFLMTDARRAAARELQRASISARVKGQVPSPVRSTKAIRPAFRSSRW
jgi:hypothetical protein